MYDPALAIALTKLPVQGAAVPWWSGDDGVGGASAADVKAFLALATQGTGALDTVVQAFVPGALVVETVGNNTGGNNITVALVGDATAQTGCFVSQAGDAVTIHYIPGTTTVTQVEAAIAAVTAPGAGAGGTRRIEVKTPGTGATVLGAGDAFAAAPLAGGISSEGHNLRGSHLDEANIYFTPTAWGAITQVELVVERKTIPGLTSANRWGYLDLATQLPLSGKIVQVGAANIVIIKNTLAVGESVCIPVRCPGSQRLRFGFRAADANAVAGFSCVAALETIQTHMYA